MNKKTIIILVSILVIIAIIIFFIFFNTKTSKNSKMGNNTTSQEIVNNILNINSYEAVVEVEVQSNKNTNKYIIKQTCKNPDISKQEILEPNNIAEIIIQKSGNELKIENTKLNLSTIFENYKYLSDNNLDLSNFISDYKSDKNATWKEENNQIIMITNKKEKKLYVDKSTLKPIRLEIQDINKNSRIYISYNEIDIK